MDVLSLLGVLVVALKCDKSVVPDGVLSATRGVMLLILRSRMEQFRDWISSGCIGSTAFFVLCSSS